MKIERQLLLTFRADCVLDGSMAEALHATKRYVCGGGFKRETAQRTCYGGSTKRCAYTRRASYRATCCRTKV